MENNNHLDIDREREAYEYANAFDIQLTKYMSFPTIEQNINTILGAVENGTVSGLEVFSIFKKIEKIFDEAKKKVEAYAFDEAEKHGAKTFNSNGCEFSIRQGYAQYNFDEDHIYSDLKQRLKEREDLLKLALKSKDMIFGSDGVEVPKVSVKGYTKDSLTIKFK